MTLSSSDILTLSIGIVLACSASTALVLFVRFRRSHSLREQNHYLAAIINSANEGIYVTDRERRFQMWNEAAASISGYTRGDIVGKLCYENILCHTDHDGQELCFSRCPLQKAIEQGAAGGPEIVYLRHRNGRRVPVEVRTAPIRDSSGEIVGGVEIFEDVTERLDRERLLVERKEKLEAVLDGIGDGILFLDHDGIIQGVNRAAFHLLDFGGDVTGKRLDELDEREPLRRALRQAEQGWSTAQRGTARIPQDCSESGSGLRCWSRPTAATTTLRAACPSCSTYRRGRSFLERQKELTWGDRTISVVSTFLELSGRERWEIILLRDVTAEKLDAALNVAGAAAHELRQPLQVLLMIAGMLNRVEGNEDLQKHTKAITESCGRMDRIIHAMTELTAYRTKDYVDGTTILDIKGSSHADRA